jgi:hypothetical protein
MSVNRILLRRAYDLVLDQWPEVIEPGEKSFHLGGGCNMRALNATHSPIDDWAAKGEFDDEIDTIIGSAKHYVYKAIHSALRNLTRLRKADLDFEAFASLFDGHPDYKVVPDPPTNARAPRRPPN